MSCSSGLLRDIPRPNLPVSVQLAMRTADHPATHVLDYLAKCEHAAVIRNRRDLIAHYHQCWSLVWEQVNGVLPLLIMNQFPKTECPPPVLGPMKGWERQKYQHPLRRVTGRRDERVMDTHGVYVATVTVLELECGHEAECVLGGDAASNAKRRRCRVCVDMDAVRKIAAKREVPKRA